MSTAGGQTALVTGASRGVGRALAVALARSGRAVGLVARGADGLAETARACRSHGVDAHWVAADLTDPRASTEAVGRLQDALGSVDLLVNNAGRIESSPGFLWDADPEDWWSTVETNLLAPFLVCRQVVPGMITRGTGRIVAVGSLLAMTPSHHNAGYAVSKAALTRLTDCLAHQLSPYGVHAFDVSPGAVRTGMLLSTPAGRAMPPEAHARTTAVERMVTAIADGRLDALSGRFLHAGLDEVDQLIGLAAALRETDARTLRLRGYGSTDLVAQALSQSDTY